MQAKAFFPAAAATKIWTRLHLQLSQPLSPQCLEAITWLLLFFPHHRIATDTDLPWNDWAARAVMLWQLQSGNSFWDSSWICLLSRLAKHDIHVRSCFYWGRGTVAARDVQS